MSGTKMILNVALAASALVGSQSARAQAQEDVITKVPRKVPAHCRISKIPRGRLDGCPDEAQRCLHILQNQLDSTNPANLRPPAHSQVAEALQGCLEKFERDLFGL